MDGGSSLYGGLSSINEEGQMAQNQILSGSPSRL